MALSIPGGITSNFKHVHQRKQDNLPLHVKGEGVVYREFSTSSTAGKVYPRTGYYIEETDKAIEFLKDEDEDTWFLLQQTPQEDSSPVKTTGLTDTPKEPAIGTLETDNTLNTTFYNKQRANHTKN